MSGNTRVGFARLRTLRGLSAPRARGPPGFCRLGLELPLQWALERSLGAEPRADPGPRTASLSRSSLPPAPHAVRAPAPQPGPAGSQPRLAPPLRLGSLSSLLERLDRRPGLPSRGLPSCRLASAAGAPPPKSRGPAAAPSRIGLVSRPPAHRWARCGVPSSPLLPSPQSKRSGGLLGHGPPNVPAAPSYVAMPWMLVT